MKILRSIKLLSLIKALVKSEFRSASDLMGEMHGLPQKLGQHFTLYRAPGFEGYFETLCTESPAEDICIDEILKELNLAARAVQLHARASIGQVYRVETAEGILAVKARYPGVEKHIKSDFRLLRRLLWPTRFMPLRNSALLPLLDYLAALLICECDYIREAGIQETFRRIFREEHDITVPEVVAFSPRAIASPWVAGPTLAGHLDSVDRRFVETYLKFILKSLKEAGMVHADPHPGNFIITGGHLTVLDFGSAACFAPRETAAVLRLLAGDYETAAQLAEDLELLGVSGETLEVYRPILGDLVSIMLEPLYYPGEYDFSGWRMQYKLNTLLASRSWERPLAIPPALLLLLRTLHGLYFYARRNFISLNWHDIIRKYLR